MPEEEIPEQEEEEVVETVSEEPRPPELEAEDPSYFFKIKTSEQEDSSEEDSAEELEEESEDHEEEEGEGDEIVVSVEGEDEEESEEEEHNAPKWVKKLRKDHRESTRKNRQLESELEKLKSQLQQSAEKKDQPIELGKKPSLEDVDYDETKFEQALVEWNERKRKLDEQAAAKKEKEQEFQKAYDKRITTYQERKAATKIKNFEDLEEIARTALPREVQSAIIMEADDPNMLVAAIGGNPKVLEKFKNVKTGVALGKLIASTESKINMNRTSKKPPPPEKVVKGAASSASSKTTLEKLEKEASRTGDRTKVIKYKRSLQK